MAWLYLPSSLSARVTKGLVLDLKSQACLLESSAMWRGKHTRWQIWLQRLKRENWMTLLSGITSNILTRNLLLDWLTESLLDIRANRFPAPGKEVVKPTQGTSGHISEKQLELFDPDGASLKMSKDTSRWDSPRSLAIWKKWVIKCRGEYSVRRRLALPTGAKECSYWRTMECGDSANRTFAINSRGEPKLSAQVKIELEQVLAWPTPRADSGVSRKPGTGGKCLAEEAKKHWPTPKKQNANSPGEHGFGGKDLQTVVVGPPTRENRNINGKNQGSLWTTPCQDDKGHRKNKYSQGGTALSNQAKGKLNPAWVEQLMGLPRGWTDLGSWEME